MHARRSWPWLAGALLLGLAALSWWQRAALVESAARRVLVARGVPASLHVERVALGGLTLADVHLGPDDAPDLHVARAALAWSWQSLAAGRLARVELSGVRVRARLAADGLELGALESFRPGEEDSGAPRGLPFTEASLRDVEVVLDSERGPLVLRAEHGAVAPTPGSRELTGSADITLAAPFATGTASLRLTGTLEAPRAELVGAVTPDAAALGLRAAEPIRVAGSASLDERGALALALELEAKELELSARARFTDLAGRLEFDGDALAGTLRVARLSELSEAPLIAPLGLQAELRGEPARLALRGTARTGADGFTLPFAGTLEPLVPRAALTIRVPETDLAPDSRHPAHIFPWLEGIVLRAKGRAAGELELTYAEAKPSARAELALRDVDLRTGYATLRRLNGVITLLGPEPLVTPPAQLLSIGRIEGPLPLANGLVRFELRAGRTLHVAESTFQLAGGTLSFAGSLPLDAEERTLVLRAEALSVAELLAALDVAGLSGTGSLHGSLVIEQRGRRVRVRAGELRSARPGLIRYAPSAGAAAAAAEKAELGTVLGALEDLRYETLELEVSGDLSEQLEVKVHARGSNPNFQQGRPVVLNVNVETPVAALLRAGRATYRVPQQIEEQVNRYFERGDR